MCEHSVCDMHKVQTSLRWGERGVHADGAGSGESMEKDDLVHDMEAVSPRSFEDGLPVSQERILKFELQLYKLKDSEYMLDVQVTPPTPCCASWSGSECGEQYDLPQQAVARRPLQLASEFSLLCCQAVIG